LLEPAASGLVVDPLSFCPLFQVHY
jgi:hypothetical protein